MEKLNPDFITLLSRPEFWITASHKIIIIIIILVISGFLLKINNKATNFLASKQFISPTIAQFLNNISKWLITIFLFLLILQQLGLSIASIWTVISAVVAMVAIGFVAVWSVLSNILCTFMLLIFQPFKVGDEVEIVDPAMTTGISGVVRNINLMFTTLRSSTEGNVIDTQIPNNLFFQKLVRRKIGEKTFSLEKQIFEEHSLLRDKIKNKEE